MLSDLQEGQRKQAEMLEGDRDRPLRNEIAKYLQPRSDDSPEIGTGSRRQALPNSEAAGLYLRQFRLAVRELAREHPNLRGELRAIEDGIDGEEIAEIVIECIWHFTHRAEQPYPIRTREDLEDAAGQVFGMYLGAAMNSPDGDHEDWWNEARNELDEMVEDRPESVDLTYDSEPEDAYG